MKDYYKILQVDREASLEVMNGAYRSLVKQCHPDQFHTSRKAVMNQKMQEINEAYQVLSNPASRAEFDRRYQPSNVRSTASAPQSPQGLRTRLKSILLWATLSYLALTVLIKPLLASPVAKLLLGLAFITFFVHIYRKQKTPKA
jgi:curved DNA-binding protein CbpA